MFTVGFIGLGLIGGSIARCLRERHPEYHMIACGASMNTLEMALKDNTVDEIFPQVDSHLSACNLIFLCAPVEYNISYLPILKEIISENCLITDVGSTKAEIHEAVEHLGMTSQFIGGHPMAGSEKSGYQHSNDHLLENAWYISALDYYLESAQKLEKIPDIELQNRRSMIALSFENHFRHEDGAVLRRQGIQPGYCYAPCRQRSAFCRRRGAGWPDAPG